MNKELKVFVVTHIKPDRKINKKGYAYIGVGLRKNDLGCEYTDDQDLNNNISIKNDFYSELSAHYWIWNKAFYKYVGLMHYRRWFLDRNNKLFSVGKLISILSKYDAVLPEKLTFKVTVEERYAFYRNMDELTNTRNVLNKVYPEYVKTWDDLLISHEFRPYNMLITSKELFNNYSIFLFKVLFELETIYKTSVKRVYGYIGELLLDTYFMHNNLNIFSANVFFVDKPSLCARLKNRLKRMLKHI